MRKRPKYVSQSPYKDYCGSACICSIMGMHGSREELEDIDREYGRRDENGINAMAVEDFCKYFTDNGLTCDHRKIKAVNELEKLANKWNIIALLLIKGGRHAVVYWQVKDNEVHFMDPASHVEITSRSVAEFEDQLEGCILIYNKITGD